jgi:uncharacterized protein (DUF305 family)
MSLKSIFVTITISLVLSAPGMADDMSGMKMSGQDKSKGMAMDMSKPMGDQGPSSQAFAKANAKMHQDMAIDYSGNPDADFVRGMIPHHQGAIDMAKIELQYGKDPGLRKLAQSIVKAQETEIAEMNAWLKKHGQ